MRNAPARKPLGVAAAVCLLTLTHCAPSVRRDEPLETRIPTFDAVQPELLSLGTSFVNAWADIDNDQDLDLFVGFNGTPNRLYRNDNGHLVDMASSVQLADARATRAAAWGDFDADGDADLAIGFAPSGTTSVLSLRRNDRGVFSDITMAAGLTVPGGAVRQLAWVDVDADGDLDLFVAFRDRPNMLFRNESGRFTEVAASMGLADTRRSVGAVWFDYDRDGDLDLYVANMDGDANGLYRNDGGMFVDVAETAGVAWGGRTPGSATHGTVRPCVADVNNDGMFDLFTANYGPNGLFLNRGRGAFEDVSQLWRVAIDGRYDACAFADFDLDGRIDLYVNGTVTGGISYRDYLMVNRGTRFEDVTPDNVLQLHADHGVQWADYDMDGDADLALTGVQANGMHFLMRNDASRHGSGVGFSIRVVDARGASTLAGAEVRVFAAGTRRMLAARLVDTGSGYNAQSDMPVHLAVRDVAAVDIEVTYPAAGKRVVADMRNVLTRTPARTPITVRLPSW